MKKKIGTIALLTLFMCVLTFLTACGGESKIKSGYNYVEKHMKNTILDFKAVEATGGGAKITGAVGVYLDGEEYVHYYITLSTYNQYGTFVHSDQYYYKYDVNSNAVTNDDSVTFWRYKGQYELQEREMGSSDKKYYYSKIID